MATPATISANMPCNQIVILMNDFTIQRNMLQQITKKKKLFMDKKRLIS